MMNITRNFYSSIHHIVVMYIFHNKQKLSNSHVVHHDLIPLGISSRELVLGTKQTFFPRRVRWFMRFLTILPDSWWNPHVIGMVNSQFSLVHSSFLPELANFSEESARSPFSNSKFHPKNTSKTWDFQMEVSWNGGTPSHHPFKWDFHWKKLSILGIFPFMNPPRCFHGFSCIGKHTKSYWTWQ